MQSAVIDLFSVRPADRSLRAHAQAAGGIVVTVEDHYEHGGIGDAVAGVAASDGAKVYKLAIREIPRSGEGPELMDRFGISARHIVATVKSALLARNEALPDWGYQRA